MELKTQPPSDVSSTPSSAHAGGAASSESSPLWWAAGELVARRRAILWATVAAAVFSVVLALLLPRWYAAEARVLESEGSGLSMLGLLNQASGGLSSLLGGGGGKYTYYLAILQSRSTKEAMIEEFDLINRYDLADEEHPEFKAIEELEDNLELEVSLEYDYLSIRAFDREPDVAATMANFLVALLNERVKTYSAQSARQTREFVEGRLRTAETALDSVRTALQDFQEEYGVLELETQTQAALQAFGQQQAEVAALEIQYEALLQQYGADNPQVEAMRQALQAARRQEGRLLSGGSNLFPVALDELPAIGREYAGLLQEQIIQAQIVETIYPLYEQVLYQEQGATDAVQVLDPAVAPVLPARPSRKLLVIVLTGSVLMIVCGFVIARAWIRENYATWAQRLQASARPSA